MMVCRFLDSYKDEFDWVDGVKSDPHKALCKACKKEFSIAVGGRSHVKSHEAGSQHKLKYAKWIENAPGKLKGIIAKPNTNDSAVCLAPSDNISSKSCFTMDTAIRKAEVLWILNKVHKHWSTRSAGNSVEVLQNMFPDSTIASNMKLGTTKIMYTVKYGLAEYFSQMLIDDICKLTTPFVYIFDESLCQVTQSKQTDTYITFFDEVTNSVVTRYFSSQFIGHGDSDTLLALFKQTFKKIPMNNLMQIGMDGPNVNWLLYDQISEEFFNEPDNVQLIKLGSCSLHTLHGCFKTAIQITGWDIKFSLLLI